MKILKKEKCGLKIRWIGSFPNNLASLIHAVVSEKPELMDTQTDGWMDDGCPGHDRTLYMHTVADSSSAV